MAPCRLRNVQFDVAIAAIATMRWTGVAHAITLSAIEDRAVGAVRKSSCEWQGGSDGKIVEVGGAERLSPVRMYPVQLVAPEP